MGTWRRRGGLRQTPPLDASPWGWREAAQEPRVTLVPLPVLHGIVLSSLPAGLPVTLTVKLLPSVIVLCNIVAQMPGSEERWC